MDPLWVINFKNNKPVVNEQNFPSEVKTLPSEKTQYPAVKKMFEESSSLDPALGSAFDEGTFAHKFIEQLQDIFAKMVKESGVDMETLLAEADKLMAENQIQQGMEDITKNLEDFDEILKAFQKFLKNPDDLTGKDPS